MPYRLTKIYTRKGDEGYTTLRNKRFSKDDLLIEVIGTIDELNSAIGLIISQSIKPKDIETHLLQIQNDLFNMGAELHVPDRIMITADKVIQLEAILDSWNATIPPLKEFVLPGGNPASATTHLARTVCRRAERCLVKLHRQVPLSNTEMLRYLNRLSDVLFVFSRVLARKTNKKEKLWEHEEER